MLEAGLQNETGSAADCPRPELNPPAIVRKIDLAETTFGQGLRLNQFCRIDPEEQPAAAPQGEENATHWIQTGEGGELELARKLLARKIQVEKPDVVAVKEPAPLINPDTTPLKWINHKPYEIPAQAEAHQLEFIPDAEYYDGCFLGRGYLAFGPEVPIELIPPVSPNIAEGMQPGETIIYVNGISTPPATARWGMRMLADATGSPVVGIYNATQGDAFDVAQAIGDKLQVGSNPAVTTLYHQIIRVAHHGESLRIMGDSQGALIISRALSMAQRQLSLEGYSRSEIEEKFSRLHIETIGGAAWAYPDGPRYVHYINEYDPIPFRFGLAPYGLSEGEVAEREAQLKEPAWLTFLTRGLEFFDFDVLARRSPGKNATIVRFKGNNSDNWVETHTIDRYLAHITPFKDQPSGERHEPQAPGPWTILWRSLKWIGLIGAAYSIFRESRQIITRGIERAEINRAGRRARQALGNGDTPEHSETALEVGLDEAKKGLRRAPGDFFRAILSLTS